MPTNLLFKAFESLESPFEVISFLQDILTPQELLELDLRLKIIIMLEDEIPQREIAKQLQCSVTTVSRGSRTLKFGHGGFTKPLKTFKEKKLYLTKNKNN